MEFDDIIDEVRYLRTRKEELKHNKEIYFHWIIFFATIALASFLIKVNWKAIVVICVINLVLVLIYLYILLVKMKKIERRYNIAVSKVKIEDYEPELIQT